MNQITQNQHYVPQFYLRQFVNLNNELEILDCKNTRLVAPRGPGRICSEEYFYGERTGQPDQVSQEIEKFFKHYEDRLPAPIRTITSKIVNYDSITPEDKRTVALLMSMLWLRGPVMRNRVNEMAKDMIKWTTQVTCKIQPSILDKADKKAGWKQEDEEVRLKSREMVEKGDFDVEVNNAFHLQILENMEKYANLFFGQDWLVYVCDKGRFITTDNPIGMFVPQIEGAYGPTFLQRTHYFALSPKVYIIARCPDYHDGLKFHRKKLAEMDPKVRDLNFHLGGFAHQYAYAQDNGSLQEILDVLAKRQKISENRLGAIVRQIRTSEVEK